MIWSQRACGVMPGQHDGRKYGSYDPSDLSGTHGVLTILFPSEF